MRSLIRLRKSRKPADPEPTSSSGPPTFLTLSTELLLQINANLPLEDVACLRCAAKSFFLRIPEPPCKPRYARVVTIRCEKDYFSRLCNDEREHESRPAADVVMADFRASMRPWWMRAFTQECSPKKREVVCSGCRKIHSISNFAFEELVKQPEERVCRMHAGGVRIGEGLLISWEELRAARDDDRWLICSVEPIMLRRGSPSSRTYLELRKGEAILKRCFMVDDCVTRTREDVGSALTRRFAQNKDYVCPHLQIGSAEFLERMTVGMQRGECPFKLDSQSDFRPLGCCREKFCDTAVYMEQRMDHLLIYAERNLGRFDSAFDKRWLAQKDGMSEGIYLSNSRSHNSEKGKFFVSREGTLVTSDDPRRVFLEPQYSFVPASSGRSYL